MSKGKDGYEVIMSPKEFKKVKESRAPVDMSAVNDGLLYIHAELKKGKQEVYFDNRRLIMFGVTLEEQQRNLNALIAALAKQGWVVRASRVMGVANSGVTLNLDVPEANLDQPESPEAK